MDKQDFKISGYEFVNKEVGDGGDSGRVYVPKTWIGKKVTVILKESLE